MNINNELARHIRLFHYFILMPEERQDKDTFFNRFSSNLIESRSILAFISYLPASVNEYIGDWPHATLEMPNDVNYQVHYVDENSVLEAVDMFKMSPFGCIFVMENIGTSVVESLRKITKMPIIHVGLEGGGVLSFQEPNLVEKLHLIWGEQNEAWLSFIPINQRPTWLPNRTRLKSTRAPGIAFLDPLTITIDRIRGLYESTRKKAFEVSPCNPDNFEYKEKEADKLINEAVLRILAEKFITLHLGYLQEGSFNEADTRRLSMAGITESKLAAVLEKTDPHKYNRLVDSVLTHWDQVSFKSEFIICVPSVNYHMLTLLNDSLKNEKIPKKVLRQIYDHSYYYQVFEGEVFNADTEEKKMKNLVSLQGLLIERGLELRFLSNLHVLYSLARRVPYIRTRNVPASNFHRLASALSDYCDHMEERNKIPDFTKGLKQLAVHIQAAFHAETMQIIKRHARSVKAISDLPIEWIDMDGLPLCVACNYSRVPITPGNGLVGHANTMNREYTLTEENTKVLLINTLSKEDNLFPLGRALRDEINHYLEQIGKTIVYEETTNKEEFIQTIEEKQPTIFIYYGHGSYDVKDMIGKLVLGNEVVTAIDMEKLTWKPTIALLGACETQVMHGTHLNVASLFMSSGCLSVLGTYFPVNGLHALTFISNIMRHLVNCFVNAAPEHLEYWDDVILQTYRTHYLLDSMHAMDRYLGRRGKKLSSYPLEPLTLFWERGTKKGYRNLVDFYRYRDDLFQEVFDTIPELGEAYCKVRVNNLILPQSLYYSSLGSPEKIKVQRGKNVRSFENSQSTNFIDNSHIVENKLR